MKIFTFLLSFILFPISVTSISAQDCTMGTAQDSIVTDHFKFVASTNSRITYENEYEHSFYTIGTWSAGLDAGGNLKGASSVYPSSSQNDYFPGPLLYDTDGTDSNLCLIWDRMFKVTEEEVNIFLDLFENNLLTEDNMPDAVKFWPSRGNPYMIEYQIEATGISADFIDVNFDGIYSPLLGDYPMLHQAAQMMYWVYNDGGGFHTLSFGKPLYQTIENYAFVYGNDPDEGMRNTLFHKVKKHNSSFNQYDKKYDGIYTDFKSRNLYTDKFGTLVDADAVYFFNNCWRYGNCNDSAYKDTIITLIKLIETPKNENDAAYGLTSTIYPFNFIGNPNVGPVLPIVEHYNLLRGLFQDGLPLTYGEDGYNTGNIDTVSFIYDDIHFDNSGWEICDFDGLKDRRVLLNTGGGIVLSGAIEQITYSITSFNGLPSPCESIDQLGENAQNIQNSYDDYQSNVLSNTEIIIERDIQLFPNPNNGKFIIQSAYEIDKISIFDVLGHKVLLIDNDQKSKIDIDLSQEFNGHYFAKIQYENGHTHHVKFEMVK